MGEKKSHIERTEVNRDNEHLHKEKYPDHWERYFFAVNFLSGNKIIKGKKLNASVQLVIAEK